MQTFSSPPQGARLDVFLTSTLGVSRSFVQRAIKIYGVKINEKPCDVPHTFLNTTDTIVIDWPETQTPPISHSASFEHSPRFTHDLQSSPLSHPASHLPPLSLLYEHPDVFVVDKPAGLLVHPAPGKDEPTLVDAVLARDPAIASVGDNAQRPGIVHRLDRLVSGVLVVARTQSAFESLKQQFQEHTTEKNYQALIHGQLKQDSGEISFHIARNAEGRMVARPTSQPGKESLTRFAVAQRYANATLVNIDLLTGRTHQIRAHFHALGHPVVGDTLYAPSHRTHLTLPRLWLHATTLAFTLPSTGERVTVSSSLSIELTDFLTTLHPV